MSRRRLRLIRLSLTLATTTVLSVPLPAQQKPSTSLAVPPVQWATDAVKNEISVLEHPNFFLRYQMHVIDEKGNQLRDVVESRDGTVARLIARDDRALTEEEDKAEQDRLTDLIASPSAYQKHVSNDASEKKRAAELIALLPAAMLYSYVPGQPQIEHLAGRQVVIDFKPDPAWKAPSMTAEALTGLRGRVWIDGQSRHMVRMEGEIFQGINVGWGMLAHVYPGGKLSLEQVPAAGPRWIFAKFTEDLTVRALLFKTIRENANVSTSAYRTVDPMTYQDAIRMLLASPLPR